MSSQMKIRGEVDFLRKLYDELIRRDHFLIEWEPADSNVDLVRDPVSGKMVAIEMKNAGDYGELPISTIIPISKLARQTDKYAKVMLITFSGLPLLLSDKLKELNVDALTQPTVSQVVEKVQLALSA